MTEVERLKVGLRNAQERIRALEIERDRLMGVSVPTEFVWRDPATIPRRPLAQAARCILNAGCSGVGQLAWNLRYFLEGREPAFPAGDTWHDDRKLHEALENALRLYAEHDGAEPDIPPHMIGQEGE